MRENVTFHNLQNVLMPDKGAKQPTEASSNVQTRMYLGHCQSSLWVCRDVDNFGTDFTSESVQYFSLHSRRDFSSSEKKLFASIAAGHWRFAIRSLTEKIGIDGDDMKKIDIS